MLWVSAGWRWTGVPENAIVEVLQNVGRNDHSYAHYITSVLPTIAPRDNSGKNSVVVFLKDSMMDIIHQGRRFRQLDLATLIRLSSSENQFACGLGVVESKMSAYHDKATLTANEKHRYGVRYEFISDLISEKVSHWHSRQIPIWDPIWIPSDLISEWFFTTITVHIGVISEINTPNLAQRSKEQRKKRVGPDDFYVKRLSNIRSDMNSYRSHIGKPFPAHFRYETDMRSIGPHIGNIILYSLLHIYI
jgi:hypothetical protein